MSESLQDAIVFVYTKKKNTLRFYAATSFRVLPNCVPYVSRISITPAGSRGSLTLTNLEEILTSCV